VEQVGKGGIVTTQLHTSSRYRSLRGRGPGASHSRDGRIPPSLEAGAEVREQKGNREFLLYARF